MAKQSDLKKAVRKLPITVDTTDAEGDPIKINLNTKYRPHEILSDDIAAMADVETLKEESENLDRFIERVFITLDLQDDNDADYPVTREWLRTVDRNIKIKAAKEAIEDSRPKDASS